MECEVLIILSIIEVHTLNIYYQLATNKNIFMHCHSCSISKFLVEIPMIMEMNNALQQSISMDIYKNFDKNLSNSN